MTDSSFLGFQAPEAPKKYVILSPAFVVCWLLLEFKGFLLTQKYFSLVYLISWTENPPSHGFLGDSRQLIKTSFGMGLWAQSIKNESFHVNSTVVLNSQKYRANLQSLCR